MAKESRPRKLSVYLYIPNIIGYIRVLMNCFAFYICSSNKKLFSVLYFVSFVCDALDGWFARKFNQVFLCLPMISTACLLVILSQVYRPGLVFLSLLALDIASHWFQMYRQSSHKDVKDSTNWLFKAYYGNRMFMVLCLQLLYITLFLLAKNQNENLTKVRLHLFDGCSGGCQTELSSCSSTSVLLVGWAIKQAVNFIQVRSMTITN
ncbi:hypothetical protein C3L33_13626, partial [Rhododendron williamsianum]